MRKNGLYPRRIASKTSLAITKETGRHGTRSLSSCALTPDAGWITLTMSYPATRREMATTTATPLHSGCRSAALAARAALGVGLSFAVALLASAPAMAALYKWTDASGRVIYSDQPPPGNVKVETI